MQDLQPLADAFHVDASGPVLGVVFSNKGELDLRAIRTMGISAKAEGSIGFFGTGLKYAIAVLLREGEPLTIYSGTQRLDFEKKMVTFRDKTFEMIIMNGEELPFTTELGKTWQVWQAYRELHCNCTDEDGSINLGQVEGGTEGFTTIFATGEQMLRAYDERAQTFLCTPKYDGDHQVDVHLGGSPNIYYRGVKVFEGKPCVFTYNLTVNVDLTEDRTLKYEFQAKRAVAHMVLKSDNEELIRRVLTAPDGTFESTLDFMDTYEAGASPGQTFLNVSESLQGQLGETRNRSAIAKSFQYRKTTLVEVITPVARLTTTMQEQYDRALQLCSKMGYEITYPVTVTDVLGDNVLGLAEQGKIFISTRTFAKGIKTLVAVLIEEYLHIKFNFEDESRPFQNYLMEKVVALGAELHGEVL